MFGTPRGFFGAGGGGDSSFVLGEELGESGDLRGGGGVTQLLSLFQSSLECTETDETLRKSAMCRQVWFDQVCDGK